jgi:hypothetical protein
VVIARKVAAEKGTGGPGYYDITAGTSSYMPTRAGPV